MLQVSARALLSASLLGTTILGAGGLAAPVFAQSAEIERPYDIPAGSLAEALNRFAAQSGVQLSYEASLAGDLRSEAVRGRMTQSEVLSRLLSGTGLVARNAGSNLVTIAPATTGTMTLSQVDVRGAVAGTDGQVSAAEREDLERRQRAGEVDTIIVTAQFQQSLIDRIPIAPIELPFTLNVTDRELMDERNFARPIDILTTLPNITIVSDLQNVGSPVFLARGFEAPVLVDNRKENAFRGSGARDDSFVDRYEVLRGPASISLGPVSSGGIINTVTKLPESDPFAAFELRVDHFGSIGAEFDLNAGSILGTDAVQLRISGAARDFQYDAKETKRQTIAIRPVLVFQLGEATALKTSASYVRHKINPNKGFPLFSDGSIPDNFDTSTFTGLANGEGIAEDVYVDGEFRHEFLDNLKLTLRGSHQSTDFDYQNTSGLYNYNYDDGGPGIGLNNPIVYSYSYAGATKTRSTFLDAQLAYDFEMGGQRQDIVVGAAYNKDSFERQFSPTPMIGPFDLDDIDTPRLGLTNFGPLSPQMESNGKLYSVFAEAAIRPTEWLTLVGGVRYDDLDQSFITYRRGTAFASGLKGTKTTFRFGSTFKLSEGFNLYASYAEAFTPQAGTRRDNSVVGPELSKGYEIGAKGDLFGNRLKFATAFFQTMRQGVAVSDPTNTVDEFFSVTIGKLRARGLEFSGDWSPVAGLNINLNYGHTDIDILEAGQDEVTTNTFPKDTASSFMTYTVQDGVLAGLKFGGGARYVGKRNSNVPGISFADYTVADLVVSYPFSEKLTASLNVQNVTDKLYQESSGAFVGRLTGSHTFGAPRTFVFTLRGRF
ncbi:MAG: TonB-dependent receptor [Sphingopyxis sp.]|uniref:TonB-dependent siderophore receptor n=1 Tax=Sphingopyxis sp. TaxID=1908224 RepID=UPI001A4B577C|nr:TonB-dependent receptor [Sphingopyxis sp.]MBL9071374.1 TonB-dependent receptor [Sphingopyxis sp.]